MFSSITWAYFGFTHPSYLVEKPYCAVFRNQLSMADNFEAYAGALYLSGQEEEAATWIRAVFDPKNIVSLTETILDTQKKVETVSVAARIDRVRDFFIAKRGIVRKVSTLISS